MKYVGEDKDTADVLVSLQHTITMANKIINDEIQVLVDDFNKIDEEIKEIKQGETLEDEDTRSNESTDENIEKSEDNIESDKEVKSEVEQTEETTESTDENVETEETQEPNSDEENRSFDISYYRNKMKEKL